MSFSREIQEKMNRFAKEQSKNYLQEAEMTYIEKFNKKFGQTKSKIGRKLAKFKSQSDKGLDAQNDMVVYMSDYMTDLVSNGLTEQEAFDRASEELNFTSDTERSVDLNERFRQYYADIDVGEYEAIGLFYGGSTIIGLIIGGLIGYLSSGGRLEFLSGGWIDTLVGSAVGLFIGAGLGTICHGIITIKFINKKLR